MNLFDRLAALEAAAGADLEPFADPGYAVSLEREILERRAVPLPPLDGVDLDATAEARARGSRTFVMTDGTIRTADELTRGES